MPIVDFEKLKAVGKRTDTESWRQAFEIKVLLDKEQVARATFQIIFTSEIVGEFFEYMDGHTHELAQLALLFDDYGYLKDSVIKAGTGCWSSEDAWLIQSSTLVYMEELVVEEEWRGMGIGSWFLNNVFNFLKVSLKESLNSGFIFVWPTVLNHLERPHSGWPFGKPTPEEIAAYDDNKNRIIKFYRQAGFRRVGTSSFFCLAQDPEHPSRQVRLEDDAEYAQPPPPQTEEEL